MATSSALSPFFRQLNQKNSSPGDYSLKRWTALTRFLADGRLCISNNAAERALRGIAVGRHNWAFDGSDEGGQRAAAIYTLIETAKLNNIDPQAWLADVLARLPDQPVRKVTQLPRHTTSTLTEWSKPSHHQLQETKPLRSDPEIFGITTDEGDTG